MPSYGSMKKEDNEIEAIFEEVITKNSNDIQKLI